VTDRSRPIDSKILREVIVHTPEIAPMLGYIATVTLDNPAYVEGAQLGFTDEDFTTVVMACYAYARARAHRVA
jgi:hypothetical protein